MTKKVRITSFLTAAVLAFTMSGVKLEKTNDYEGEHIRFNIIATAEAESNSSFRKAFYTFAEPSKLKSNDDILAAFQDEYFFGFYLLNYCPEVLDRVAPEDRDVFMNTVLGYAGDGTNYKEMLQLYTDTYDVLLRVQDTVINFLEETIPLQKDFKPSNGIEMYTLARRLVLETMITLGYPNNASEMMQLDQIRSDVEELNGYIANMGVDYDFDANFKKDSGKIKPLYNKIYKALTKFYSGRGAKMSTGGTKLIGLSEVDDFYSKLEPYDENTVIPFERMLDPMGCVDEPFEEEMATVGLAFALADFRQIGGLAAVCSFTGYDYTTGNGKILWDYVNGVNEGTVRYKAGDFAKVYPAYQEFVTYLAQYFRMCHLDRPELIAENGEQLQAYTNALFHAEQYMELFYGSYLNERSFAADQFDSDNYYILNRHTVDGFYDTTYNTPGYYESMQSAYAQTYSEIMRFCDTLCNSYLENGEELRPTQLTK